MTTLMDPPTIEPAAEATPTEAPPAAEATAMAPATSDSPAPAAPEPAPETEPAAEVARTDSDIRLRALEKQHTEEREIESRIAAKDAEILNCEGEIAVMKNELKSLEDSREKLVSELRGVIRGDGATLYDGVINADKPAEKGVGTFTDAVKAGLKQSAADQADADQAEFDALPISTFAKGAVLEKLDADGIRDGKALREWINAYPAREIKGIGKTKREELNVAMGDFFIRKMDERKSATADSLDESKTETIIHFAKKDHSLSVSITPEKNSDNWRHSIAIKLEGREVVTADNCGPFESRAEAIVKAGEFGKVIIEAQIKSLNKKGLAAAEIMIAELDLLEVKGAANDVENIPNGITTPVSASETTGEKPKPHTAGQKMNGKNPGATTRGRAHKTAAAKWVKELHTRLRLAKIDIPKLDIQREALENAITSLALKIDVDGTRILTLKELEDAVESLHQITAEQLTAAAKKAVG